MTDIAQRQVSVQAIAASTLRTAAIVLMVAGWGSIISEWNGSAVHRLSAFPMLFVWTPLAVVLFLRAPMLVEKRIPQEHISWLRAFGVISVALLLGVASAWLGMVLSAAAWSKIVG